jgi:hypothetical protein
MTLGRDSRLENVCSQTVFQRNQTRRFYESSVIHADFAGCVGGSVGSNDATTQSHAPRHSTEYNEHPARCQGRPVGRFGEHNTRRDEDLDV